MLEGQLALQIWVAAGQCCILAPALVTVGLDHAVALEGPLALEALVPQQPGDVLDLGLGHEPDVWGTDFWSRSWIGWASRRAG